MNSRYVFDDASRKAMIVNQSPMPGEQPAYTLDRNWVSYAIVASLPKAGGKGNVLLLFGLLLSTIDGAGRFVTDEMAMTELCSRLASVLPTARLTLRSFWQRGEHHRTTKSSPIAS